MLDPLRLLKMAAGQVARAAYRVRDGQRKIHCLHPDYPGAYMVLPPEWLGLHAIRKDRAVAAASEHGSQDITQLAAALALLDDWGGIPGVTGKDPGQWDLAAVPIPLMSWLVTEALSDFMAAYAVPKASSPPLPEA